MFFVGEPFQLNELGGTELFAADQIQQQSSCRTLAIRVDQLAQRRRERRLLRRHGPVEIDFSDFAPGDVSLFDQDRQVRPQRGVFDRLGIMLLNLTGLELTKLPQQPHDIQFAGRESGHVQTLLQIARGVNHVQNILHVHSH